MRLAIIEHDIADLVGDDSELRTMFLVYARWSVEAPSIRAWEHLQRRGNFGVLALRARAPVTPPHTEFVMNVVGERRVNVERVERVLRKYGGEPYEPERGLDRALVLRRIVMAAEQLAATGQIANYTIRTPAGRLMDRTGRMEPLRRPQG
jgi:hypothetical protein